MTSDAARPAVVITGATGRLGRLLRLVWPASPEDPAVQWTARRPVSGMLEWDIGTGPDRALPRDCVVLHLAAVLQGDPGQLAQNATMARAVCRAAWTSGARHVFLASTAAVYRPGPDDIAETTPPDPATPYGAAKHSAEQAALLALRGANSPGLTLLRIGNVAGADALLGRAGQIALDPVAGQSGGPLRSYIGPNRLAAVLGLLIRRVTDGRKLPTILNLAEPGVVAMADLLTAAGRDWTFGPSRVETVGRVGLDTSLLCGIVPMRPATAQGIVADLNLLAGRWP